MVPPRVYAAIVAYSPLCRGFLAAINGFDSLADGDRRKGMPRFQGEAYEENKRRVQRFFDLAASKGCTPSQLALAWVHAQGEDVFPIPGTKSSARITENAHAVKVLSTLSAEDIAHIAECAAALEGGRYAPEFSGATYNARM
jgi:aryl-alcohol dehydrogenase-like predicted oxidoreductase